MSTPNSTVIPDSPTTPGTGPGAKSLPPVTPNAASLPCPPGSVVAQSVVGPAVQVGRNCRIERSVLLADARLGDGVVVTEAVVGPSATIGAGAVLSDLTLIGADAHVASGARLSGAKVASTPIGDTSPTGRA